MIKELNGGIIGATSRAVKYGNLKYKIVCALLDYIGYSNHSIHDLEVRNKVYRYVEKKYHYVVSKFENDMPDSGTESHDVWICWFQGMENAPSIVKKCYNSILKWMPNMNIHVLDRKNLFEYITLPPFIIEKWEKGIISDTLFSDFVRLSVLIKYGGIWIDSTVYMTGPLPMYIKKSQFFMYQSNEYDNSKLGESWFIKANAGNRILQLTLSLMNEYWRRENKMRDYFIMFICMKIASNKYANDLAKMPKIPSAVPILMQKYLLEEVDEQLYNELFKISPIHKLTYKLKNTGNKNILLNKLA
ncbi:capsular polysaccharide synthesis protein [Enterococcus cecorum]|uniref:capsular polysaccharide synthesis protein n=1 Tax=Enterococcus cecorum TaxID=44008 RepID=UPI00200B6A07|nr:capsular polysaccharide synthesis protein [Enterococcus cecorum]